MLSLAGQQAQQEGLEELRVWCREEKAEAWYGTLQNHKGGG